MSIKVSYLRHLRSHTETAFEYGPSGMHVLGSRAAAELFANAPPSARLEDVGKVLFRNSRALVRAARGLQRFQYEGGPDLEDSMHALLETRVRLVSSRFAEEYCLFQRGYLGSYRKGTAYLRIAQGLDELAETHSHEAGHGLVDWLDLPVDEVLNEAYPILLERQLNGAQDRYLREPYKTASRLVEGIERASGDAATLAQRWAVLMRYERNDTLARDLRRGRIRIA